MANQGPIQPEVREFRSLALESSPNFDCDESSEDSNEPTLWYRRSQLEVLTHVG
ncbi:hypothetical protein ERO13_A12G137700v2 [Gossypium hirsutum]|uniref:Uncharacterized protein n=4 Tax=Gossypium TaxID=3633 RepID=A0A5J5TFT2_GOSBA|nr:hypothetical protein ES319_A12G146400v1 [Gossypium barbadense]KAG4170265.1 hypothetical protein ERO13_A12G137700v2 [Gossypium hirsutum]TYG90148.1 hypothetical protein ES288_A12G159300v1 [Gossypium darwinii]TYH96155.1 hypothetical protein ES332_A12G159500v1 [Gossypium tomentosum]TYJ05200.1 hypothetical protein E1A91_A12G148800v1 [Gossypium mustelinum]